MSSEENIEKIFELKYTIMIGNNKNWKWKLYKFVPAEYCASFTKCSTLDSYIMDSWNMV